MKFLSYTLNIFALTMAIIAPETEVVVPDTPLPAFEVLDPASEAPPELYPILSTVPTPPPAGDREGLAAEVPSPLVEEGPELYSPVLASQPAPFCESCQNYPTLTTLMDQGTPLQTYPFSCSTGFCGTPASPTTPPAGGCQCGCNAASCNCAHSPLASQGNPSPSGVSAPPNPSSTPRMVTGRARVLRAPVAAVARPFRTVRAFRENRPLRTFFRDRRPVRRLLFGR